MTTQKVFANPVASKTLADILHNLGDINPARVRWNPLPGTATVKDAVRIHDRENRLFELADGVLIQKRRAFANHSWESASPAQSENSFVSPTSEWFSAQTA
jgi:hypothetical protein